MAYHVNFLTAIGLFVALAGPIVWLSLMQRVGFKVFSIYLRSGLWLLMLFVLALAYFGEGISISAMGFNPITYKTPLIAIAILFLLIIIFALGEWISKYFKLPSIDNESRGSEIIALSISNKIFIVISAGIIEEILFRSYSIERLESLVGSTWFAGSLALTFFVLNHARSWSKRHLLNVLATGTVLTIAYVIYRDIVACILAHIAIDFIGFIIMPSIITKRRVNT